MTLSYRSPKTAVRHSKIHGKGLFAIADIAAGEIVAVKGGYVLTAPEWRALEPALGSARKSRSPGIYSSRLAHRRNGTAA